VIGRSWAEVKQEGAPEPRRQAVRRRRQWWRRPERSLLPRLRGRMPAPFSRDPRQLSLPGVLPATTPPARPREIRTRGRRTRPASRTSSGEPYAASRFSPAERRNWGYWDGVHARERGRLPPWSRAGTVSRHPFDKPYGEAFWLGWYGETHPNAAPQQPR
jgi:hypothetical protein